MALNNGAWFKAANKSLIWYAVGAFERAGVVPPDNIDRLLTVAETLSASGLPAFAVGGGHSPIGSRISTCAWPARLGTTS
jgi:hypothetical protein